jgi:hypothetical protein
MLKTKIDQFLDSHISGHTVATYVEKHLPLQIHFQVCEGLRILTDMDHVEKLENFEHAKLREIASYHENMKGQEP